MQELEKILEEIDAHAIEFETFGVSDDYISVGWVKEIIRKHMNDNNSCGECSRRKWYQIGYKDGKDDGWISAEERMPEEYGEYLVTIVPSAGYLYTGEVGKIDFEDITDMVIAWRPIPEPYQPEREGEKNPNETQANRA